MVNENILISFCIPTYNRAEYLKNTIESIVTQKDFDARIEIVINDNCSTDNTKEVVDTYSSKYSNIKYFCNNENIRDENFPTVLSKAEGVFRKLHNDSLLLKENALTTLIDIVNKNIVEKPLIFFLNNGQPTEYTKNLEQFMKIVSFNITYIGAFSMWGKDEALLKNHFGCEEHLWQVPFLMNYATIIKTQCLSGDMLFNNQVIKNKDISYGLYHVFYENFLTFVRIFLDNGMIKQELYDWLEKDLLFNFFINWINISKVNNNGLKYSKTESLQECVERAYADKNYFQEYKRELKIDYRKKKIFNLKMSLKKTIKRIIKNVNY